MEVDNDNGNVSTSNNNMEHDNDNNGNTTTFWKNKDKILDDRAEFSPIESSDSTENNLPSRYIDIKLQQNGKESWHPAKITKINKNGTVNVTTFDHDYYTEVPTDDQDIRYIMDSETDEEDDILTRSSSELTPLALNKKKSKNQHCIFISQT